jgi:hypothetical protein
MRDNDTHAGGGVPLYAACRKQRENVSNQQRSYAPGNNFMYAHTACHCASALAAAA